MIKKFDSKMYKQIQIYSTFLQSLQDQKSLKIPVTRN